MKTILAALLFSAAFTLSASACDRYVARDYSTVRMEESEKAFTVSWGRYAETYPKAISKNFGVLMESAAFLSDPKADTHYITRDKLTGDVIFDSIVFIPACD